MHPSHKMLPTLIVLGVSTILNAIYFLKTFINIYVPAKAGEVKKKGYCKFTIRQQKLYTVTIILFIILNLILGLCSQSILRVITVGLNNFA